MLSSDSRTYLDASNYTLAYPILQDYNLKATIAVVVLSSMVASDDGGLTSQNKQSSKLSQTNTLVHIAPIQLQSVATAVYRAFGGGHFLIDRKYLTDEGRRETDAEYRDRINQDLRLSKYVLESELNTVVNYFAYRHSHHQR